MCDFLYLPSSASATYLGFRVNTSCMEGSFGGSSSSGLFYVQPGIQNSEIHWEEVMSLSLEKELCMRPTSWQSLQKVRIYELHVFVKTNSNHKTKIFKNQTTQDFPCRMGLI